MAQQYINDLPAEARETEILTEDERIRDYEHRRTTLMARVPKAPEDGINLTKDSSHTKSHWPNRPYYCSVSWCPRSEGGGKGFKRKNEMISHGFLHESPGYLCPFCPELEHKYPRLDSLQRYTVTLSVENSSAYLFYL